ncbi:MAG: hypothetical protein H7281_15370 [Bacteriovorax sp.]|nr:hypothetical protein [Bacteriovorax sp.]
MNRCLFSSVLLVIVFATAMSFSNELFTQEERIIILNVIDNVCADSWCEGDYDYEFLDFVCNSNNESCDLVFLFINTDDEIEIKSTLQNCHFLNITNLAQVIEGKDRGFNSNH